MLKNRIVHRNKEKNIVVKVFSVTHKCEKMLFTLWFSFELLLFIKTSLKYPRKNLCNTLQARGLT